MNKILQLLLIALFSSIACAQKPRLVSLAEDGFPEGSSTPEGAACDLVRAFINLDSEQFQKTCLPKMKSGTPSAKKYNQFIEKVVRENSKEKESGEPHKKSPKEIGKVFAARHLSRNGPSSYGYAVYNYQEVMFVDVGAYLHDGSRFLNRTMVVKTEDGKWLVHPCPTTDALLSSGLNDEPDSTVDFKTKYRIGEEEGGPEPPATDPKSTSGDEKEPDSGPVDPAQ